MAHILITGTSKGIGYDTAIELARAGHDVIATMRNPEASDLGEKVESESLTVSIVPMDVDDETSVTSVFQQYGPSLDVLVNNAGILSLNAIEDEDLETFEAVMNTNFFGSVRCTKAVLPFMREKRDGCIINTTSIAGIIALSPEAAYCASKAALESFTEILAQEMKRFNVKVHILEPGIISTPMATTNLPKSNSESLYPGGRRMAAIMKNAEQMPAPATIVAEKIKYLIESDDDVLRHPVGPDALPFLGWRLTTSDEEFRDTLGADTDEEFKRRLLRDTMIDLSPYLD